MKKSFLILLFVFTCFVMAYAAADMKVKPGAHVENELTCMDCHGVDKPTAPPEQASCENCHGDMTDAPQIEFLNIMTQHKVKEYIHDSHQAPVPCMDCHKVHAPSKLYCDECHVFEINVP